MFELWKNLRIFCNNVTRSLSSDCDNVKMGLKDKFEEDKTANQSGLDADLKLRGYRNDIDQDVIQDLQKKPAEVLIIKRDGK